MNSRKCKCFDKWPNLTDSELGNYRRAEQGKSHWINEIQSLTRENKALRAEVDKLKLDASNTIINERNRSI
jgi:cell division protein FtsB